MNTLKIKLFLIFELNRNDEFFEVRYHSVNTGPIHTHTNYVHRPSGRAAQCADRKTAAAAAAAAAAAVCASIKEGVSFGLLCKPLHEQRQQLLVEAGSVESTYHVHKRFCHLSLYEFVFDSAMSCTLGS